MWKWLIQNWFDFISAIGIVASFTLAATSLRSESETRRIANLLTLTQNHRQIWSDFYKTPSLSRVLDPRADLAAHPATKPEEAFVKVLIQHLASAHRAMQSDLTFRPEGLAADIQAFFDLPIPRHVWKRVRLLQTLISFSF
jgi:hypothetical protein